MFSRYCRHVEADTYAMLCRLLNRIAEWFAPPPRPGALTPAVEKVSRCVWPRPLYVSFSLGCNVMVNTGG